MTIVTKPVSSLAEAGTRASWKSLELPIILVAPKASTRTTISLATSARTATLWIWNFLKLDFRVFLNFSQKLSKTYFVVQTPRVERLESA